MSPDTNGHPPEHSWEVIGQAGMKKPKRPPPKLKTPAEIRERCEVLQRRWIAEPHSSDKSFSLAACWNIAYLWDAARMLDKAPPPPPLVPPLPEYAEDVQQVLAALDELRRWCEEVEPEWEGPKPDGPEK